MEEKDKQLLLHLYTCKLSTADVKDQPAEDIKNNKEKG